MLTAVTGLREVQPANRLYAGRKERIQCVNQRVLSVQYSKVQISSTIHVDNQLTTLFMNCIYDLYFAVFC